MIILIFIVVFGGVGFIYRNHIALWLTTKRMAYRHYVTLYKIKMLKALHDIGIL